MLNIFADALLIADPPGAPPRREPAATLTPIATAADRRRLGSPDHWLR